MTSLRFALRQLWRHRGNTVVAILTLGLGIGLVTTQFSLIDGLLLRPLPFPNADRLFHVARVRPDGGAEAWQPISQAEFQALRAQQTTFSELAGFRDANFNLTHDAGSPRRIRGLACTANLLTVLGTAPLLGRAFRPEDDLPGQPRVVLLGHQAWHEVFGADPGIVGRAVQINGEPTTVLGIMPPGFRFPGQEECWVNLRLQPAEGDGDGVEGSLQALGLLAPGRTRPEAVADLEVIARRHQQATDPAASRPPRINVQRIQTAHHGGGTIPLLQAMLGMTGFVLLLACGNVANLQLNRAAARARELALRTALGAGRGRLARQILAESLILAALAALAGLGLAALGVHLLRTEIPPRVDLASWTRFDLNPRVLGVIAVVSLLSGLVAGLLPAWRVARVNLNEALKDDTRGCTGLHLGGLSRWLAAGQVAFACALTIAAGLLALSAVRSSRLNLPFQPDTLLLGRIELQGPRFESPSSRVQFYNRLLDEVAATPGVAAVAVSSRDLVDNAVYSRFELDGQTHARREDRPGAWLEVVSRDYFRIVQRGALQGRVFASADGATTEPVAVVNASFARRHWPGADPVGRRIRRDEADARWATVVGVVPDLNMEGVGNKDPAAGWYLLQDQQAWGWLDLLVRGHSDPRPLVPAVRAAVARVDAQQPIHTVVTLAEHTRRRVAGLEIVGSLATLFAVAALVLAGVGIYGIMSSVVRRRTREFGIRLALGSTARGILSLLLRQNSVHTVAGIVAGLVLGVLLARPFSPYLPQVSGSDPSVFVAVPLILAFVAALAIGLPARRAARVDPAVALRSDE